MTTRRTRAEQQEETRRRLLDAASAVFAESGFEGASIDAITQRAGYTRGAFYSNFASKAELLIALSKQRMAAMHAELLPRVADATGDAQFEAAADWLLTQSPPTELLLLVELGRLRDRSPEADDVIERFVTTARGFITDTIANATALSPRGDDRDDAMTGAILAVVMGAQLLRHLDVSVDPTTFSALLAAAIAPHDTHRAQP
ncbi:MAG: TetR/AcrR family transcriptional regulator [Nitriliruptoraceae bacterium]